MRDYRGCTQIRWRYTRLPRESTSQLTADLRPTIRWSGQRPRYTPSLLWRMPCGWCQMAMAGRKCTAIAMVGRYGMLRCGRLRSAMAMAGWYRTAMAGRPMRRTTADRSLCRYDEHTHEHGKTGQSCTPG